MDHTATASVRYMIDDVSAAIAFYTQHLGFTLETDASPAFASVVRGPLRLLLSGSRSSGARPMRDGSTPKPGGWTRILVPVDDIESEVTRLREAGVTFRNDIVKGVGGSQALLDDPSGNPVELFQPS
jgi:predicted enzyme related to lactoylglutathione lyase